MTPNIQIQCEKCHEILEMKDLKTGVHPLPGEVEHHYLQCPKCQAQYTSFFLDPDMKLMQTKIKRLRKKKPFLTRHKNKINALNKQMQTKNTWYMNQYRMNPLNSGGKNG